MASSSSAALRERILSWERAAPELEALRREEIRRSDQASIPAVIPTADLMQRLGIDLSPATGLVEQQAWFGKLRHA